MTASRQVLFSFWGRRGALSQFALDLARCVCGRSNLAATFCISRQNESFAEFKALGVPLLPIETFSSGVGAISQLWRIPGLRRQLSAHIRREKTEAVIELMPHVWSPLLLPAMRRQGVRYATIIHDASAHPGDITALVKPVLDMPLRSADRILTLSNAVTDELVRSRQIARDRISTLFHPDLAYADGPLRTLPAPNEPVKLLFLGRIMAYKGLSLFVDAVALLKARGFAIEPQIYGEGPLGAEADRLAALGATIVNRWLSAEEIGVALQQAHLVVLSHIEASQSGVAAAAFGAGVPVVATPVGGLVEQIRDGETGILARAVDAAALADAIARAISQRDLYNRMTRRLLDERGNRSMSRFIDLAIASVRGHRQAG